MEGLFLRHERWGGGRRSAGGWPARRGEGLPARVRRLRSFVRSSASGTTCGKKASPRPRCSLARRRSDEGTPSSSRSWTLAGSRTRASRPSGRALARGFHDLIEAAVRPLATNETLFTWRELRKSRPALARRPSGASTSRPPLPAPSTSTTSRAPRRHLIGRNLEAGDLVIGHADSRAEHVRFESDGDDIRIAAIYDWDSLQKRREPALVGVAASCFCANWAQGTAPQAPTLDEAKAFVTDYEAARGRPFEREERHVLSGVFAYTAAFLARCGHPHRQQARGARDLPALGLDGRRQAPGPRGHGRGASL